MLWACLLFPDLPLRAVFDDAEQSQPCAVVDGPRQRQQVAFVNARAKQNGVGAGRTLAAARAVCAALQARARDRAAEQRLLLSLAAWAYRFSSQVSLRGDDALLIEVGASLRLFGGWPALQRRLRIELAALGFTPSLAVASAPGAARVLAACADGFYADQQAPMLAALGGVALAQSGLAAGTISLLYNVGARTLRDAFALPRPELARRVGAAELAALDRLRGIDPEILPLYQPPDRFEHRVEFDYRIEAWPPLMFPLRRLCGELALFLAARDGGVQRCELVLDHEDHAATRIAVEFLTPQREARTLYDLLRSRIERAGLCAAVCGLALVAADLPEFRPRHQDLFDPKRAQGLDWPELAERLRAYLGDDAVRRLAAAGDHRPELAWCFANTDRGGPPSNSSTSRGKAAPRTSVKTTQESATIKTPAHRAAGAAIAETPAHYNSAPGGPRGLHSATSDLGPRPLWLLKHALPLRGPAPRILAGPERIESGWWDGGDARRDYYVVQTRDGQHAWAYLAPGASDGWMLHGWFA